MDTMDNKESCQNKNWMTKVMLVSTIIFFVIVTFDRCTFHNEVYKEAKAEVIKEMVQGIPIDSLSYSSDSSIIRICVSDKFNFSEDNYQKQLDILTKSDSLLSANSLTYLVTLIVALLASILLNNIDKMEKAIKAAETSERNMEETTKDAKDLNEKINSLKSELTHSLDNNKEQGEKLEELEMKLEESLQVSEEQSNRHKQLENKTELYYKHINIFDYILNQIACIFNLSIMISNATSTLSPSKSNEENEIIAKEVAGSLCSRLELICDNNIKGYTIDYLTTDEKNIIITYLDDAHSALKRSHKSANSIKKEKLKARISNNINSVNSIIKMIDSVEIRDENKAG